MKNTVLTIILAICLPALLFCGCAGNTEHPENIETDAAAGTSVSVFPEDETEAQTPEETPEPEPEPEAEAADEAQTAESSVYSHVVIIGVDGAGAYFKDADMPKLEAIFENGARTYRCLTSDPTISAQSWGSLMTGTTPECHRLSNSYISANPYPLDSIFPTFFHVVRDAMPDAVLGSFCNWNPINVGIVEDGIDVTKGTAPGDSALTDLIVKYVKAEKPTVLFVQFDEVDGAGHGSGFGGKQQLAQLHTEDGYIDRIHTAYEEAGILDDTLFIVTADHGGNGTSHGGWTDGEKYIMWAAAGKTVIPGGEIQDMGIRDTASVVLMALGIADKQPDTWTSRVPSGLFEGVEAVERPVYTVTYQYGHRTHESEPTPAVSTLTDIVGEKRVLAYLPMDEDVEPAAGSVTTKQNGKLYYVDGYFGSGIQFDDGYITLSGYQPDKDSFSVGVWMKTGGVSSDPCIFSNKDWDSGANKGFVLSLRDTDVKFNLGNGGSRMDAEHPLPLDYKDGWVYVILVVDRDKNQIRFSYDFGSFTTTAIPNELADTSFTALKLNIGQDGSGRYGKHLEAVLDEFLLIEGTLTDDDVAALKAHYGN
ncbi:MAG: alkaline phosphatase family protein [Clostridiales bacterium]|nr:alkaline phosphatase family protein [Clostridiales bacterium]